MTRYIRVPVRERPEDEGQLSLLPEGGKARSGQARRQGGASEGVRRKRVELTEHQIRHREILEELRRDLADFYRMFGGEYVTADDAVEMLEQAGKLGTGPRVWLGALFKSSEWEFTGRWVTSRRPENNGRQQRCWRLRSLESDEPAPTGELHDYPDHYQ